MKVGGIEETLPHPVQPVQHHPRVQALQPVHQRFGQVLASPALSPPAWFSYTCSRVFISVISQLSLENLILNYISFNCLPQPKIGLLYHIVWREVSAHRHQSAVLHLFKLLPQILNWYVIGFLPRYSLFFTLMSDTMVRSVLSITRSLPSLVKAWW